MSDESFHQIIADELFGCKCILLRHTLAEDNFSHLLTDILKEDSEKIVIYEVEGVPPGCFISEGDTTVIYISLHTQLYAVANFYLVKFYTNTIGEDIYEEIKEFISFNLWDNVANVLLRKNSAILSILIYENIRDKGLDDNLFINAVNIDRNKIHYDVRNVEGRRITSLFTIFHELGHYIISNDKYIKDYSIDRENIEDAIDGIIEDFSNFDEEVLKIPKSELLELIDEEIIADFYASKACVAYSGRYSEAKNENVALLTFYGIVSGIITIQTLRLSNITSDRLTDSSYPDPIEVKKIILSSMMRSTISTIWAAKLVFNELYLYDDKEDIQKKYYKLIDDLTTNISQAYSESLIELLSFSSNIDRSAIKTAGAAFKKMVFGEWGSFSSIGYFSYAGKKLKK